MRRLALVTLVVLIGCKTTPLQPAGPAAETASTEQPLRIDFAPPDGRLLHEKSTTTRVDHGVTEKVEASMTSRYDARKEGGWVLTQWVPQIKLTRDEGKGSQAIENPLVELVTRFPVKVELARDGAFVRLTNREDAEAAVRSTFPDPQQAATWISFFSPEAIEEQSRREWESKYAGLFNRNLTPGSTVFSLESILIGQTARFYVVERKLTARTQTQFGEAAVFAVRCLGKPAELEGNEAVQRLLQQQGSPELEPSTQCEGQQLFALSPFVPVRSWMRLTVKPAGQTNEVTLNREASALKLE